MSGTRGRPLPARGASRDGVVQRLPLRAQLPLLDRLIDEAPEKAHDAPLSPGEAMSILRRSVRNDIEALLNSRRRWRTWQASFKELSASPLNYGIPDCTGGRFHDANERETLRREIEDTIRRFEPRFRSVRVRLTSTEGDRKESTLRLRIEAILHAEPAPEPIAFDTMVDPTTADVLVRTRDDG
jgi:type VI secretion system protein ImpF